MIATSQCSKNYLTKFTAELCLKRIITKKIPINLTMERRTTSVRQLELLLDFMEAHRDLAMGRVRSKEARSVASRLWTQCAEILNSEGASRSSKEWSRFWNDYKCRVRNKLSEINKAHTGTGGGPNMAPQLTPLEERVAGLIGRDIGPLPGVRIDPVIEIAVPEMDLQVIVPHESHDSPTLDLSSVINLVRVADPDSNQTQADTPESPLPPPRTTQEEQPSTSGIQLPPPPPPPAQNSRRERRSARPRVRRSFQQTNTTALDDARASIARIEEIRARTEETLAAANLRQGEAAIEHARALTSIANSMQIIAESVQRYFANLPMNN